MGVCMSNDHEDMEQRLNAWAQDAQSRIGNCRNEEATKLALIIPFFELLGYDVTLQRTFSAEARAGIVNVLPGRADFVILDDHTVNIVVECKTKGTELDQHESQLGRYFEHFDQAHLGILTNGIEYRFFARQGASKKMSEAPFLFLNLNAVAAEGLDEPVKDFLDSISERGFSPDGIAEFVKRGRIQQSVNTWWRQQLKEPSHEVCGLVLREQDIGRVTSKVIDRYRPIVADALVRALALEVKQALSDVRVDRDGITRIARGKGASVKTTTQREYEVFGRCKTSLASSLAGRVNVSIIEEIQYKDHDDHITIYLGGPSKGRILKFYEYADGGELFEFNGGESYREQSLIEEPLQRSFQAALSWHRDRK